MRITTLEDLGLGKDDLCLEPKSVVEMIFHNGTKLTLPTPIGVDTFAGLWDRQKNTIKIPTSYNGIFVAKKCNVDAYWVYDAQDTLELKQPDIVKTSIS